MSEKNTVKPAIVRRTVTLRDAEEVKVLDFGKRMGLDFSSALRYIINDWARMQAQRPEALAVRGEGEGAAGLHGD